LDDATLEELRYLLYQKIVLPSAWATMGRMAKLLNMTLKKTLFPSAKGTDRVLTCDMSSGKKSDSLFQRLNIH
jgi:hypothetical protein